MVGTTIDVLEEQVEIGDEGSAHNETGAPGIPALAAVSCRKGMNRDTGQSMAEGGRHGSRTTAR